LAKPDACGAVDGGDWLGVLGGFAVSGVDEEVSRGDAGKGRGGADVWRGVSVGPHDAAAGAGITDDGELAGREPDWDDVFVLVWAGRADVFGDGPATANGIQILKYSVWGGGGNSDGSVHELRRSDRARILCCGHEQRIGAGGDVCFTGFECSGAGDDVCIVSSKSGRIEIGYGAVFDFCVCAGDGFARGREIVCVPDRNTDRGKLVAGDRQCCAVVCKEFLVRLSRGVSVDDFGSGAGSAGDRVVAATSDYCAGKHRRNRAGGAGGSVFAGANGV